MFRQIGRWIPHLPQRNAKPTLLDVISDGNMPIGGNFMNQDIFETLMLICFWLAWPFSIYKMLKTKRSHGKSLLFIVVIFMGYIFGILFEWFGERNSVIFLYIFNAVIVLTDLLLTIKYRKNESWFLLRYSYNTRAIPSHATGHRSCGYKILIVT